MFSIPQKMINEKHIWLNKKKDFYFKTSGSFRIKCKLSFVELNINTRESYRVFIPRELWKFYEYICHCVYFI